MEREQNTSAGNGIRSGRSAAKKLIIALIAASFLLPAYAQKDTVKVPAKTMSKKVVEVKEDASGKTEVSLLNGTVNILDNPANDTTSIRIGRRNIEIVDQDGKTDVTIHRIAKGDDQKWKKHKNFNGHWAGFELGVNGFTNEDYSLYEGNEFMELDQPKSLEVNINFMEYSIVLSESSAGLVTGMGFSMNNYRFDNDITLIKDDTGIIQPETLPEERKPEKSKLTASYLTVPLLLEFQIPVNGRSNRLFISGGLIGGLNLGSHTKVKFDDSKEKDRGSFNLNPFRCSATVKAGFNDISLFASYGLTPFFKNDKGPELFPFSIGISLINF